MIIDIITLFPEMFVGPFDQSIIKRAQTRQLAEIRIHNLRKWGINERGTVDDRPYGGGVGMLLRIEPIYKAIEELKANTSAKKTKVILMSPQGVPFSQQKAQELSQVDHLIFISGHYEGYDERIREHLVDEEISIGDYVLTGGELPTMVVVDASVRLLPGVITKEEATQFESFQTSTIDQQPLNLLEFPQYTRPEDFMGWKVPELLLSGNHGQIEEWKQKQALKRTRARRPDLLSKRSY